MCNSNMQGNVGKTAAFKFIHIGAVIRYDVAIPDYLRQQIQTIRDWYEEMKKFWDQRSL